MLQTVLSVGGIRFAVVICVVFGYCCSTATFDAGSDADDTSKITAKPAENNAVCFCKLEGHVDDCNCPIDELVNFNNLKIYPRIRNLVRKNYFSFYEVNLRKPCPFWQHAKDDGGGRSAGGGVGVGQMCASRACGVEVCPKEAVFEGLHGVNEEVCVASSIAPTSATCYDDLDYLDATLSVHTHADLKRWASHDGDFCDLDDDDDDDDASPKQFYDLRRNPERYTGYAGPSARSIWQSIYVENCFRRGQHTTAYQAPAPINDLCLEERIYYRAISGLHSSISIHLSAMYPIAKMGWGYTQWGPNLTEFQRRFSPETTNGEGPNWLRNLYFVYLLEFRALVKIGPFLRNHDFYTDNSVENEETQMAVRNLLDTMDAFPYRFDESGLFAEEDLKTQFRQRFHNVTHIMDCVGCDKCRLWGKLQTHGLGTALRILFGRNDEKTFLKRGDIVALFNAFGRLSTSIYKLDDFKQMLLKKKSS